MTVKKLRWLRWSVLVAAAVVGFVAGALDRRPAPGPDPLLNLAFGMGEVFDVQ